MRKARRRSAFGIQHSEFSIGFLVFVSGRMSALPNPPCGPSTVGWRAAQGGHSSYIWGIVPVRCRDVNRYSLFRELFFSRTPFSHPPEGKGDRSAPPRGGLSPVGSFAVFRSLVYFDDAENDFPPSMLVPFDWEQANADIRAAVEELA